MRSLHLAFALAAAAVATGAAAGDLPKNAAESNASYSCRVQLTPASRTCLASCDAAYKRLAQEDERWSCVQSCTTEHIRAVRECREEATATVRALQPRRDAAEEEQPIAFDAARLTD